MGRRIGIAQIEARHLIAQYHGAAATLEAQSAELEHLLTQASNLLDRPMPNIDLRLISEELSSDASDLEERLHFLERTDRLALSAEGPLAPCSASACRHLAASHGIDTLLRELAATETLDELTEVLDAVMANDPFLKHGLFTGEPIPEGLRGPIAGYFAVALESGWENNGLPLRFLAGVLAHGEPDAASTIDIARQLLLGHDVLGFEGSINPFALPGYPGLFGPARDRLVQQPQTARAFISQLLDDYDQSGDTALNMHEDQTQRAEQLAEVVLAAGSDGPISERVAFVDRLISTLNADGNTNDPVFWATWASHATLVLDEGAKTTAPTFGTHRLVPDAVRPHWEHAWNQHLSPALLEGLFHAVGTSRETLATLTTAAAVNRTFNATEDREGDSESGDPGGAFSTRAKEPFRGLDVQASPAERGRHIVTHALFDASPEGAIAGDEFAIIDHGHSFDGTPTFTLTLPGVIDLSTPVPGFDPVHRSVRDMDQVAIHSAPTAEVADNQYAQMVLHALEVTGIPHGSNLLIVGNSFGADTAIDIAANEQARELYNITHVVAAAYDSVPQLAHVPSEVDVLVLQNTQDQAIALERFHRWVGQAEDEVSVATFTHEVREFDGGLGSDLGHHPDRYIEFINTATDPVLEQFFASVDEAGFTVPGATVAIDVSVE